MKNYNYILEICWKIYEGKKFFIFKLRNIRIWKKLNYYFKEERWLTTQVFFSSIKKNILLEEIVNEDK